MPRLQQLDIQPGDLIRFMDHARHRSFPVINVNGPTAVYSPARHGTAEITDLDEIAFRTRS